MGTNSMDIIKYASKARGYRDMINNIYTISFNSFDYSIVRS